MEDPPRSSNVTQRAIFSIIFVVVVFERARREGGRRCSAQDETETQREEGREGVRMGEAQVKEFMLSTNRPWSVQLVVDNMQKHGIKKAAVQRHLDSLGTRASESGGDAPCVHSQLQSVC